MESYFDIKTQLLYEKAKKMISTVRMLKSNRAGEKLEVDIPQDFKDEFFHLVDQVNLSLMEEKDNFYGYFLFEMSREIRFDIPNPTGIHFNQAHYVISFNPILFLTLSMKQMESTIKHEIHHILSLHLIRAKELKGRYSTLAINIAMDIVVNQYLDYLPPYAMTLERVHTKYGLKLEPYEPFEYYVEKVQTMMSLMEEDKKGEEDNSNINEKVVTEYNPERTHDIWEESDNIDEKTIKEFTGKFIDFAIKGTLPDYLERMIALLKNSTEELSWDLYLKKIMGSIESNRKKTVTRRNRRQPERLDLRGELRSHKAKIAIALDISGSITDEEFNQAIKEVLHIVKSYSHEITIIECDNEIRRVYKARSLKDIKERIKHRGSTMFSPVFDYVNKNKFNLLVYFTDGKGEERLRTIPRGYKVLWIISGRGNKLSLKEHYGVVKKLGKLSMRENKLATSDTIREGYSMNNQEPIFKVL